MQINGKLMLRGAGLAVCLATLAGCSSTPKSDERSEGRTMDDQNITENVKTSLEHEPVYKFTDVDVKTFAGIVQLSGFVNTPEQKHRAQDIAEHVQGVNQVVNGLTLKPQMVTPTSRKEGEETRIYSNPDIIIQGEPPK